MTDVRTQARTSGAARLLALSAAMPGLALGADSVLQTSLSLSEHPWFYSALALATATAISLGAVATFVGRLNRRLRRKMRDHQLALQQLSASEERLRLMVDVMASPLLFVRLHDGLVLYGNRKAREIFRLEGGNPDQPFSVLACYADPHERDRLIEDVRRHGVVHDREIQLRLPSGAERLVLLSSAMVEWQGEASLVSSFVDITERKRFENALHDANATLNQQLQANEQLQQQLQVLAISDPLTSLYNRRHLEEALPRELARARREGGSLALVMLDIDHFKSINDRHGHLVGDQLLILYAAVLRDEIRAGDVPCRYGGEEFLLMLPGLDVASARERAEHWRQRLQQTEVRIRGGVVTTTVSIGIACFPAHGSDWDSLVGTADAALYRAKQQGRNQVVVAG